MATVKLGYALSSEEHTPNDLVRHARLAEQAGFTFALISDHFHPWVDAQGHSPFVWSVLGAIAQATERLELGTGVTCPTIRMHPAIVAHAAATVAAMMPGRFFLGLGTGENLNEHILGDRWPPHDIRLDMLEEAVEVIRLLWRGGSQSHHGKYYTVENARLYTLPEQLPRVVVAAAGPRAAEAAGRFGDGLCSTAPEAKVVEEYTKAGGKGPRYGQITVCWAASEAEARRTALKIWPNAALGGELSQELPTPAHFEQATSSATEAQVAESVICGPDPQRHRDSIKQFIDAGFDHIYIHQVGPDQAGFINFYQREILPQIRRAQAPLNENYVMLNGVKNLIGSR
jgi:G6PDH family F420-dependent oxidoreductase